MAVDAGGEEGEVNLLLGSHDILTGAPEGFSVGTSDVSVNSAARTNPVPPQNTSNDTVVPSRRACTVWDTSCFKYSSYK